MAPRYEASVRKRPDTILRKIDVRDWKSPVAQQFKIQSLPQLVVYSPDGAEIKRGYDPAMLDDPTSGSGGSAGGGSGMGESGPLIVGVGVIVFVALLLFVVTKVLGPQKKPS
jgi:hypothetical protein